MVCPTKRSYSIYSRMAVTCEGLSHANDRKKVRAIPAGIHGVCEARSAPGSPQDLGSTLEYCFCLLWILLGAVPSKP